MKRLQCVVCKLVGLSFKSKEIERWIKIMYRIWNDDLVLLFLNQMFVFKLRFFNLKKKKD